MLTSESRENGPGEIWKYLLATALLVSAAVAHGAGFQVNAKRMAVLPFDSAHVGADGNTASDLFNATLVRTLPGLSVVERSQLSKILGEQALQQHSGILDKETAARLQSILGVDSLVIGSIVALDHAVDGGAGTMMMTARLVDTATGRILWADSVTTRLEEKALRKIGRFFSGAAAESDALVTSRLLEQAAGELARGLGAHMTGSVRKDDRPPAVRPDVPAAAAPPCAEAEARITRLGESVLGQEALYWAHRLREEPALDANPGATYADPGHRRRLTTKVLFWMDERDLPALSAKEWRRLADAKDEMKRIRSECGPASAVQTASARVLPAAGWEGAR